MEADFFSAATETWDTHSDSIQYMNTHTHTHSGLVRTSWSFLSTHSGLLVELFSLVVSG